MARPLGMARMESLRTIPQGAGGDPQSTVQVAEFFREQKGMDLRQLPDGSGRGSLVTEQWEIVDGVLQQAYRGQTTAAVGSVQPLVAVFPHRTTAGVEQWIFLKSTGFVGGGIIEIHTNAWRASASVVTAVGAAVTFNFNTAKPSFVTWGDRVLICNGTNGLIDVNVGAGTYAIIAGAPTGKHISIVANRAIITGITNQPYRVQWSIKNDYTNWAGLGSGFEDIREISHGTSTLLGPAVPYDENFAFLFSDKAIFAMVPTDYFDAPFRFTTMEGLEGTINPYSIARCPDGLMYLGNSTVWLINRGGKQNIGEPIKYILKHSWTANGNTADLGATVGAYDRRRNAYVLATATNFSGANPTYHCYLGEGFQWTRNFSTQPQIRNLFEYPDVQVVTDGTGPYGAGLIRTQYASIGSIGGLDQFAILKHEYEQMWETYTTNGIGTSTLSYLQTPQIVPKDPARTITITEIQYVVGIVAGSSATYNIQAFLLSAGGTSTQLATTQITTSNTNALKDAAFIPASVSEPTVPVRWMYTTLALRRTITTETAMLQFRFQNIGDSLGPMRVYAIRVHYVDGPLTNE